MRLPLQTALRLAYRKLRPRTRMAWFTVYVAGLELLLLVLKYSLQLFGAGQAAAALGPWSAFLVFLICALLLFLGFRWFRNFILWRLRNRLIVTYLFIGGVPVFLVALMAFIAGHIISGQFATFLVLSEIRDQAQVLEDANASSARQILRSYQSRRKAEINLAEETVLPGRTLSVLPQSVRPKWLTDGFSGLVVDRGKVYLRAANIVKAGDQEIAIVSSVPVDEKFLARIAAGLGPLTLEDIEETKARPRLEISAGSLPPRDFRGDRALDFSALIQPTAWDTGATIPTLMIGSVRMSTLYSRLSVSVSDWANTQRLVLTVLAGIFAIIVLIALLIGIRLTRTITRSVANLYEATQHINRGDFTYRIAVKERDQLATLQVAFNSMTESLEKLIVEQKEKERLQSELEIAQEVQALLFPRAIAGTSTLDVCGLCRPARIVSGDYYDFLSYGAEQLGIAIGDISGKGISAALLMATIHSAVRAYEQDQTLPLPAGGNVVEINSHPQSPSQLLSLLNRHLYRTTQPEKYATLFLGFYDGHNRQLVYSNAGHLPPLILGQDGSVRHLETGGTVVGLFENVSYEEGAIQLSPQDLFVAFSDGITEPENEFGEFGEQRLIEAIAAHRNLPLQRIVDQVLAAVQDWIGSSEQPDDITLVLARARV